MSHHHTYYVTSSYIPGTQQQSVPRAWKIRGASHSSVGPRYHESSSALENCESTYMQVCTWKIWGHRCALSSTNIFMWVCISICIRIFVYFCIYTWETTFSHLPVDNHMHPYMHARASIYACTWERTCSHLPIDNHMHVNMHVLYTRASIYRCTCIHMCMYIQWPIYTRASIYACTYSGLYTHVHPYIHAHTCICTYNQGEERTSFWRKKVAYTHTCMHIHIHMWHTHVTYTCVYAPILKGERRLLHNSLGHI